MVGVQNARNLKLGGRLLIEQSQNNETLFRRVTANRVCMNVCVCLGRKACSRIVPLLSELQREEDDAELFECPGLTRTKGKEH